MILPLPASIADFAEWPWSQIEPHYQALIEETLTPEGVAAWLANWSTLSRLVSERFTRLSVAKSQDTGDEAVEAAFNEFLETLFPKIHSADQSLKVKLVESGLIPEGMDIPLKKMRADIELFREENLPLLTKERQLSSKYDQLVGAETVEWAGQERTLSQLKPYFETTDRNAREQIWRLASERRLADRDGINEVWGNLLGLRQQLAANAGYSDYREYRWQQLKRFDYTPQNCREFHDAIEQVVVPAANRVYEGIKRDLGVEKLRPWDVQADVFPLPFPVLRPYTNPSELDEKAASILRRVDPQLGDYFDIMRREDLLDLANRKGKAPGGYCTSFQASQRPFIFMNAVGTAGDVKTILHEAGHAFHVFESSHLPYVQQLSAGSEFAEVASMTMELLSTPYLTASEGGYYTEVDAALHRVNHLQKIITFWPYMAVVDGFQHWVYENPEAAKDSSACDAAWVELTHRFIPAIDWTGLEAEAATGWQRKLHIHRYPFYYVEYGLAQLGAIQIWRNALSNQSQAVAQYRQALSLGGTRSISGLFEAAGARFAFDADTMRETVELIELTLQPLETAKAG